VFSLGEILRIVGGAPHRTEADALVRSPRRVVHDSRHVTPGDLFLALPGERTDGHAFLAEAYARGAFAAIVSRASGIPDTAINLIVVNDPLAALHELASAWRRQLTGTFVAVTGTCGKTTTKALTAQLVEGTHVTYAAPENYNTEIGVPLALLAMPRSAEVGLFELGAERPGDIAPLARLVDPQFVVLTRVGHGHLTGFGSLAAVAEEKWSAVTTSPHLVRLLVNADDRRLRRRAADWPGAQTAFGVECGTLRGAVRGSPPPLHVAIEDPPMELSCALASRHHVTDLLAAVAVALELGVAPDDLRQRATGFRPAPRRLQPKPAPFGLLLDDSYNANPESTFAALDALAEYSAAIPGRAFVFGDMLSLGRASDRWHRAVLRRAIRLGIDPIIPVGERATHAASRLSPLPQQRIHLVGPRSIEHEIRILLSRRPPTILLVKGSRAVGLDRLVDALASG